MTIPLHSISNLDNIRDAIGELREIWTEARVEVLALKKKQAEFENLRLTVQGLNEFRSEVIAVVINIEERVTRLEELAAQKVEHYCAED